MLLQVGRSIQRDPWQQEKRAAPDWPRLDYLVRGLDLLLEWSPRTAPVCHAPVIRRMAVPSRLIVPTVLVAMPPPAARTFAVPTPVPARRASRAAGHAAI